MAVPTAAQADPDQQPPRPRPKRRRLAPGPTVLLLALAAISLMLVDVRGGVTEQLRTAGNAVVGPLQAWADAAVGSLPTVPVQRAAPDGLEQEALDLRRRNQELSLEVDRLEQLLRSRPGEDTPAAPLPGLVSAPVVASGPVHSRTHLTIAAGSSRGVAADSAVLVGAAVVGRVVSVGPATSVVQLISDPDSGIAVRLRGSRETALALGTGEPNRMLLDFYDPLAAAQVGERLVTVGSPGDRPFPAGLTVGTIAAVSGRVGSLDRTVSMQPSADLTAVDTVEVLLPSGDGARSGGDSR